MTPQELQQLAKQYAGDVKFSDYHDGLAHGYEAGFRKALELVAASCILSGYDEDTTPDAQGLLAHI